MANNVPVDTVKVPASRNPDREGSITERAALVRRRQAASLPGNTAAAAGIGLLCEPPRRAAHAAPVPLADDLQQRAGVPEIIISGKL